MLKTRKRILTSQQVSQKANKHLLEMSVSRYNNTYKIKSKSSKHAHRLHFVACNMC